MNTDVVIVGAGLAGISLARRMAEEKNYKVLLIERRMHIGGDCYDYLNHDGIMIHKYGPHIFRTSSQKVYEFMSRFTEWIDYQHKVLAYVEGHLYPMPINLDTVNEFLGSQYSSKDVLSYFDSVKTTPSIIDNVKDVVESQVGERFYKAFFENYTKKQWGEEPEKLPTEIVSRIPIRNNRDDRYFTHTYQGIPKDGYTELLNKMMKHPNIRVMLNTEYEAVKNQLKARKIYYSGSIDQFYDNKLGALPYRCVSFKFEELEMEQFQPVSVVNYPNNYDYTRITEFKHFTMKKSQHTVIAKEYPSDKGNPSYPIPVQKNINLYREYLKLNDNRIEFIGRLGKYKYFSMDQIVEDILMLNINL